MPPKKTFYPKKDGDKKDGDKKSLPPVGNKTGIPLPAPRSAQQTDTKSPPPEAFHHQAGNGAAATGSGSGGNVKAPASAVAVGNKAGNAAWYRRDGILIVNLRDEVEHVPMPKPAVPPGSRNTTTRPPSLARICGVGRDGHPQGGPATVANRAPSSAPLRGGRCAVGRRPR